MAEKKKVINDAEAARVDSELRPALNALAGAIGEIDPGDIQVARMIQDSSTATALAALTPNPDIVETRETIKGLNGAPDLGLLLFKPKAMSPGAPAFFWIHGGGMIVGSADQDTGWCRELAESLGALVVSLDYRLAPESPYPAALEDCVAAYQWMLDQADSLGISKDRIGVGGASAGGGLCAGLTLYLRDNNIPLPAQQTLVYPMIDDTNIEQESDTVTETLLWTRVANKAGWGAYLKDIQEGESVPIYAAPYRAEDLSGLPQTIVVTGELDLFRQENITFAQRLLSVKVPCSLHLFRGVFHGTFAFLPDSSITLLANEVILRDIKSALGVS